MRRNRWVAMVLGAVVALLLAACVPATPPIAGGGTNGTDPDVLGAYRVGRATFTLTDPARGGRALPVDAWYPVDPADAEGVAPSQLDLLVTSLALPNALHEPPVSDARRFPLVVFSHGSGGVRFQSWFLMEHLASQGYLVIAPDHVGNTAIDALNGTSRPFEEMAVERPRDVTFVIDQMLARAADPSDRFGGRIDGDHIAVVGHSFGGFTALAAAAGFGPVPSDPRVDAIVPIAPASSPFSDEQLAAISTPTLLVSGTSDVTTPIAGQTVRPWELLTARPAYRADVLAAGHGSFTNVCELYDALVNAGLPPELLAFLTEQAEQGCAPELIPIGDAHRLTNLYVTAFLRRVLDADGGAQRYLTKGYAVSRGLPVDFFHR